MKSKSKIKSKKRLRPTTGVLRILKNAYEGGFSMRAHWILALLVAAAISAGVVESAEAQSPGGYTPPAYGQTWGQYYSPQDWERFYHYPYVYYPQNYWGAEYFKSANHPYFRYPQEMRTPVYNKKWFNFYPSERLYHSGHHFNLDVF
ncbi:MAG: calmodulin-binding protein [Pirellulales bacterium]|nr:calmodulin-binding protein [Pirellulales bacterium]